MGFLDQENERKNEIGYLLTKQTVPIFSQSPTCHHIELHDEVVWEIIA
jgi:hypothetical protein